MSLLCMLFSSLQQRSYHVGKFGVDSSYSSNKRSHPEDLPYVPSCTTAWGTVRQRPGLHRPTRLLLSGLDKVDMASMSTGTF
eukprot:5741827-Amphidinium_carterae.1